MSKHIVFFPLLSALTVLGAVAEDFTLVDGTQYRNVEVNRTEPDGIVITTDSGVVKIEFANLPPAVQQAYGFDEEKAAAFREATKSAQRERNLAKVNRTLDKLAALETRKVKNGGVEVSGFIVQSFKGDAPIEGSLLDTREYTTPNDGKAVVSTPITVFIEGLTELADREAFRGTIYPTGRVLRVDGSTYRAYAITPDLAADRIREKGEKTIEQVVADDRARWAAR